VAASKVLHARVPGDDHGGGSVGAQAARRSQPVFELAVIGFYPVVGVLPDVVLRGRDELVEHGRADRRGVGDQLARHHLQYAPRAPEEPAGRISVLTDRDQHVDDLPQPLRPLPRELLHHVRCFTRHAVELACLGLWVNLCLSSGQVERDRAA
jgi:hypothetical protein